MKLTKIVTFLGYIILLCLVIHFVRTILKINNDFLTESFNFREGMTLSNSEKDKYNEISTTIEEDLDNYIEKNNKSSSDFVTSLPEDFKGTLLDLMEEKDKKDVNDAIRKIALKAKSDPKSAIKNIMKELDNIKEDNMVTYEEMRDLLKNS